MKHWRCARASAFFERGGWSHAGPSKNCASQAACPIYPTDIMPPWLKTLAHANPLSFVVDGLRSLMLVGAGTTLGLGLDFAVLAGGSDTTLTVASAPVALKGGLRCRVGHCDRTDQRNGVARWHREGGCLRYAAHGGDNAQCSTATQPCTYA
jgi:hypothetical protein